MPRSSHLTFDSGTWRQLCTLVDDRDVGFLDKLFQTYLQNATAQIHTLRYDASTETKRRAAHTLMGSSLSVGVTAVAVICRKLELELGKVPVNDMPDRLAKIEAHLRTVEAQYPVALAEMTARQSG